MHPIVDDVCGHHKGDAGKQHAERILSCGDGYPAVRHKVGEPADQQLDKGDNSRRCKLDQTIVEQIGGVLLRKNPAPVYV